ncbi:MAG TPA: DNA mismatch repair endonuclease MutL [Candidatus Atopostipes pullistercoris]|uniref:DNA mismatch repair protein MutL n=1 Tax=Candidatus Atopostipes pullistercoris TaxID=2838467 RepID=A0A9D2G1Y4_9LACT|nr:DNA mismatch repair endonuclease MutL [Candidatus Atopostipes pullistercoris]
MSEIKILSETLANQIAAGEVVERPASVIKELVENAIDAESTKIKVEIEEAGLLKIVVTDDGKGIPSEDVERAFERHATSKIYTTDELFRIRTLGFRGEALPSIASVSELTIETAEDKKPGKHLYLKGGEIVENTSAQSRRGTMIKVEQLFYNTPARLKHIRSLRTEISHITNYMNRFALSNPDISFEFINDGNQLMKTVGNGDIRQAIASVYGVNIARKMREIEAENFDFKVSGYTSLPEVTRANNSYITLIVNGRYIHNYSLNRAVIDGYSSTLMIGRYPIAVINIEMDPLLLDVNVHPTKQQIRISNEKELGQLIKDAIYKQMHQEVRIPGSSGGENLRFPKAPEEKPEQLNFEFQTKNKPRDFSFPDKQKQQKQPEQPQSHFETEETEKRNWRPEPESEIRDVVNEPEVSILTHEVSMEDSALELAKTAERKNYNEERMEQFPELEYIGQMHGTYLLTQNEEGLFIIDQHAAQERIKYEYYKELLADTGTSMQDLLVPIVLEYPSDEVLIITDNLEKLANAGLKLEPFGQNSFIVREHPTWIIPGQEQETIEEMIDFFLEKKDLSIGMFREATAIMMSCKRSIKANHHLSDQEAISLIEQLPQAENPYNCPHGRPTLVKMTTRDLEKMFKRIQDSH